MPEHDHHKELCRDWGLYALYELLSQRLDRLENNLITTMATVTEAINAFKAKQDAHNAKIDAAVSGLTGDISDLKALIDQLQNSQGQITAADQALLDEIDTRASGIADKLEALDAITPPSVPTP